MEKVLKQGDGWRIGWNFQAEVYQGLIGGEDWAIELTKDEFNDFRRLLSQLATTMTAMKDELMAGERIACEAESDLLWLEVEGFPNAYGLRAILNRGRRCEGNWSVAAARELVQAIQNFSGF